MDSAENTSLKEQEPLSKDYNLIMLMSSMHIDMIKTHLLKKLWEHSHGWLTKVWLSTGVPQSGMLIRLLKLFNMQTHTIFTHQLLNNLSITCLWEPDSRVNMLHSLRSTDTVQLYGHLLLPEFSLEDTMMETPQKTADSLKTLHSRIWLSLNSSHQRRNKSQSKLFTTLPNSPRIMVSLKLNWH